MQSQNDREGPNSSKITLCLSGGGFRATFFHLGVVRYLAETGLLQHVTHVFSVSGGSILAAHMAQHWEDYCSADEKVFRKASNDLIRFAQSDLRGRILRRWPLLGPIGLGRTKLLEREYTRLFSDDSLGSLRSSPRFHFLSTSLTRGCACGFTQQHFFVVPLDPNHPTQMYPADSLSLALAVAASSAFPPMFPPLALTQLPGVPKLDFAGPEYLTDGGIYDNLGVNTLNRLLSADEFAKLNTVIVSNATATFDEEPERTSWPVVSRTVRSTDILMNRLSTFDELHLRSVLPNRVTVLSIQTVVSPFELAEGYVYAAQDPTVQRLLKTVRTDLDVFRRELIQCLVMHGHEVATQFFHDRGDLPQAGMYPKEIIPWNPMPSGWPDEDLIRNLSLLKRTQRVFADFEDGWNKLEGSFGVAIDDRVSTGLGKLDAETKRRVRARQKELGLARHRRLGLVQINDWTTWLYGVLVLAVLGLLSIFVWNL